MARLALEEVRRVVCAKGSAVKVSTPTLQKISAILKAYEA